MTLRYKLRTLLILLAILPPLLGVAWVKHAAWKAEQERRRAAQNSRRSNCGKAWPPWQWRGHS